MKAIYLLLLLAISVTIQSQVPGSGKLKVYKLQSNYISGLPSTSGLNSGEGIGVFNSDGVLIRKVSTAALGLPSGSLYRVARFTGGSSIGNTTHFVDSLGFYGIGQIDGTGLGTARLNIKTQGNSSSSMGVILRNSSNAVIGLIKNDGSFQFGGSSLIYDDATPSFTAAAPFRIGTSTNQPMYEVVNNNIITALDASAYTINVPVENAAVTSYTGLAKGTTAQRPTATAGRIRYNTTNSELEYADGSNFILVPKALKGTTTWQPGIVAAGSSATTTLTVTGAATADVVHVNKVTGGLSNGEIYDAWVSATNTVTIRVHNVSTGSANYNTTETYNCVLLKY